MLQDLLRKILIDYDNKEKIIDFIKLYKKNSYIYASALKEYLKISDETTYNILIKLYDNGVLEINYILYCPYCDNQIGIFNNICELNKEAYCGNCDRKFDSFEQAIVAFKVIK